MAEAGELTVLVRLFAGARVAAGVRETCVVVPVAASVGDVTAAAVVAYPGLARVLPACSLLLDEVAARPEDPVGPAATLDVLPPFSGGC